MDAVKTLAAALAPLCNTDEAALCDWIEVPKNTEMGDYAFPCFRLSKTMRRAPNLIAAELKDRLALPAGFERCEAVGG